MSGQMKVSLFSGLSRDVSVNDSVYTIKAMYILVSIPRGINPQEFFVMTLFTILSEVIVVWHLF